MERDIMEFFRYMLEFLTKFVILLFLMRKNTQRSSTQEPTCSQWSSSRFIHALGSALLISQPSSFMMAPNLVAQFFPLSWRPCNALITSIVCPSNCPNSGPAMKQRRAVQCDSRQALWNDARTVAWSQMSWRHVALVEIKAVEDQDPSNETIAAVWEHCVFSTSALPSQLVHCSTPLWWCHNPLTWNGPYMDSWRHQRHVDCLTKWKIVQKHHDLMQSHVVWACSHDMTMAGFQGKIAILMFQKLGQSWALFCRYQSPLLGWNFGLVWMDGIKFRWKKQPVLRQKFIRLGVVRIYPGIFIANLGPVGNKIYPFWHKFKIQTIWLISKSARRIDLLGFGWWCGMLACW